jgi:hypothetical protein
VKKYLQHMKNRVGMSAEKQGRSKDEEKQEREEKREESVYKSTSDEELATWQSPTHGDPLRSLEPA